jgi:2',3'-cyclic-nucleotide 2'-phosphodiesterase/3'-nucleotidase
VVDKSRTTVEARGIEQRTAAYVAADPAIAPLVAAEHAATIRYVQTPVGTSDFRMSSYFADVGDISAIEVVNQAQTAYVQDYVKANLPQYAALPVLSMASPFKAGAPAPTTPTSSRARWRSTMRPTCICTRTRCTR